ncbi:MAG TPA: hypothetical protein VFR51_06495 [Pyrinomonadaceae bacterium]|nr:hypothetical protein [Pyrinomonadaceae bacterium]
MPQPGPNPKITIEGKRVVLRLCRCNATARSFCDNIAPIALLNGQVL